MLRRARSCAWRVCAFFGANFVVLPRFTPANAAELASAFAASTALQGGDPLAVVTWQQRVARVSDGVARFDDAMRYAEALSAGEALNLQVAQLPYHAGDRWIGLPRTGDMPLPGGRLSLIAHTPAGLNTAQPLAGLWLNELLEVAPNDSETTGVVFQYDQPNAAAPQAVLLAVPPDPAVPQWTAQALVQVSIEETLDLTRIRAVGLDALGNMGQFLPGLVLCLQCPQRHNFHRLATAQCLNGREDVMASITTWTRLKPLVPTEDMQSALQARIYDPLWMLARQWQTGEFQGEDTGSPIVAHLRGESAQLTRYLPGLTPGYATRWPALQPAPAAAGTAD